MDLHLLSLILITTTTAITHLVCGERILKMPLTINPLVQHVITGRSLIFEHFYRQDPVFFSRLTPADIVMKLNNSLEFVMQKKIVGAIILGMAAKEAGLKVDHIKYQSDNKWTFNVSLTDIQNVLTDNEKYVLPLADNITLTALQKLGLRVLEKRYNVSLGRRAEPLHLSKATRFELIQNDWIQVVRFITETNVKRLAARYQVSVTILAGVFESTAEKLYGMTLDQLDVLLSTPFNFVNGSLEVVVPTVSTTAQSTTQRSTTQEPSTLPSTTTTEQSTLPTTIPALSTLPITTLAETTAETKPTLLPTKLPNRISESTAITTTQDRWRSAATKGPSLKTLGVEGPTEGSSDGATTNLALFVGVAVGLLLLLVASSTIWCYKHKRQRHLPNYTKKKPKNNNYDIKVNNFWVEKNDIELQSSQDEPRPSEQVRFVSSPRGNISGGDSRFKGLKYGPTSSTFDPNVPLKAINSRSTFENDTRREIFV